MRVSAFRMQLNKLVEANNQLNIYFSTELFTFHWHQLTECNYYEMETERESVFVDNRCSHTFICFGWHFHQKRHTHTLDILVMLLIPCLSHCVTFKCFSRLYIAGDQFIWLGNKFPTIDTFLAYQIIFRLIFFSFVVCHHSGMFIIVVGILYCCCHFMFGYLMSWGWKMCEKSCVENIIIFFGLVL